MPVPLGALSVLPDVGVFLDDGTDTFPYDVTTETRAAYTISRGRQDELADVTPGRVSLTLDNSDGRFTLGSTTIATPSPVTVNQRIRVVVAGVNRFTGYVQQWPVEWPSGSDLESLVPVIATDVQARAERWVLKSPIQQEALLDGPSVVYKLDEPVGATGAADSSENSGPVLFNISGGSATAVAFDGSKATFATGNYLGSGTSRTVSAGTWIVKLNASSGSKGVVWGPLILGNSYNIQTSDGAVVSPGAYDDGAEHVVALTLSGGTATLYVAGSSVDSGADASITWLDQIGDTSYAGTVAWAMFFPTALSSTRIAFLSLLLLTGQILSESGTDRITRLAGYVNLPVGTLDTPLTVVASQEITGKSAAVALRDVADAEMGLVFVDGSGDTTFHNRNRAASKTAPDISLTADMVDPGTAFQVDTQGLINYYEVTAEGTKVTQIVRDATSEGTHGRYPNSKTYLVQTDMEALDRGSWTVTTHAAPAPRVASLVVDLLGLDATTQADLLAAELDTWIRVTGLPSQTPGGTTADLVVQGFTEALMKDSWSISFNVVSKALTDCLVLDDPTRGILDANRLYV